jgi:H+-transporting ATPase
VLGISTVLGVIGVVAAFGLFYLGQRVFHLDHARVQTLMYLKLSVAGHLTIFLTRTRGPFWSIRPAKILWIAVLGTQIVATLIAVYGLFMSPLGWRWAGFVWVYALAWFLVNDRVKLLAYRIFDSAKAEAKPESRPEAKPGLEVKAEPKPEVKAEAKPDAKADVTKPETKVEAPKPAIKAETKPEATPEANPDAKTAPSKPDAKAVEPNPEVKAEARKPDAKTDQAKPEAKAEEPKPEVKAEAKAEDTPESKPDNKPELQPEAKPKTPSDLTPQISKRAYELYEERGRKGNLAAQDWAQAKREIGPDGPKAEPKPATVEPKSGVKAESKTEVESIPEASAGLKPELNGEPKAEAKAESNGAANTDAKPEAKAESNRDLTPQLVNRVHELYEELGREEVRAVEKLEKAERQIRKDGTNK